MSVFREGSRCRRWQILAMVLVLIASASTDATASIMTYEYGGVITSADPSTGIAAGTRFSGTFTYDTADLSSNMGFGGYKSYYFGNQPGMPPASLPNDSGLTFSLGSLSIGPIQGGLGVSLFEPQLGGLQAPAGTPMQQTHLRITTGLSNNNPISVSLAFGNPSQTIYSSLALPPTISLANFPSAVIDVYSSLSGSPSTPLLAGTIDTLTPLTTPEPSAAIVLGVAVAAWLMRSRCRVSP